MIIRTAYLRASILAFLFVWLLPHSTLAGLPGASYPPVNPGASASFSPPITPSIPGNPGADKYLQSNGAGVVSWAAKPAASVIGPGTGWVKQTAPGTFGSYADIKPAGTVRAEILDRVSPTAGVVRIIQLVFPQSGPGQWRVYGVDW